MTSKDSKNILIVKYSSLGDIVNAIPAVKFLRHRSPKARIYWLVKREYLSLLCGEAFVDDIIVYEKGGLTSIIKKIRSLKIDTVIDLQGIFKSGLIGYLSGASRRVSFPHTREGSSVFYTERLGLERKDIHAVTENLSVIEGLVGESFRGSHDFGISLNGAAEEKALELLKGIKRAGPLVAVSSTSRWKTKMWGAGNFAVLSDMLVERMNADVVFTGAEADFSYIEDIRKGMKTPSFNLAGKTDLKTLAWVFKKAGLVISCDSGAMHLASATGAPVIAIFGPTDPRYTGPFGRNSAVITKGMDCSPCRKRRCPDLRCMEEITPRTVFEGAGKFLSEKQ